MKQSSLNSQLSFSLKQDVATRWNSELIMLESYLKVSEEIADILVKNKRLYKLNNIDNDTVKELVGFLKPFGDCTEAFSKSNSPTIQKIAPWYQILKRHIQNDNGDSDEMKQLKAQALICFNEYCKVEPIHYVAAMLHPK